MDVHNPNGATGMSLHSPDTDELQGPTSTDMDGPTAAASVAEHGEQVPGSQDVMMEDSQEIGVDEPVLSINQALLPIDDRLQTSFNAFHASYASPVMTGTTHMQRAKDFASALLQRHYPDAQQYKVEASALGPLAKHGINFELKADEESDSDIDLPRSKGQKTAHKKKKHIHADPVWHSIELESMAAFVVQKGITEVLDGIDTLRWYPHTYLVILIDDLSTFPRWSRDNINHRGDVLADLSGIVGNMQRGHGMLLFGPRLELYSYRADNANKPIKPYEKSDWRIDMRTTSLTQVDDLLRTFTRQEPVYKDGH